MLNFCSYLGGASSSEGEAQSAAKCRVSGPIGILYNYITYIQIHTYGYIRFKDINVTPGMCAFNLQTLLRLPALALPGPSFQLSGAITIPQRWEQQQSEGNKNLTKLMAIMAVWIAYFNLEHLSIPSRKRVRGFPSQTKLKTVHWTKYITKWFLKQLTRDWFTAFSNLSAIKDARQGQPMRGYHGPNGCRFLE